MELYTIQLAQWRKAKSLGIPLLDSTMKSGEEVFAPTEQMVRAYKAGHLSETEYTSLYIEKMTNSFKDNRERWLEVARMETLAVACYCKPDKFCHRHLLVACIERLCRNQKIHFESKGEIY